jgi:hypothetical protein
VPLGYRFGLPLKYPLVCPSEPLEYSCENPTSPPVSTPVSTLCVPCEYPSEPLEYPLCTVYPWEPFTDARANEPFAARCATGAVQPAPQAPVHGRMGYPLGTHRVLTASMDSWPQKPARAAEWIARKQSTHVSGNGPKWECVQVGTNARTRRRVDRPSVSAPPAHAHIRTHAWAHALRPPIPNQRSVRRR